MSELSELQIELIKGDIRQGGVEMTELQDDLLDHACCALEEAMLENPESSFDELYPAIRELVCPNGWYEIQAETTYLLTYKFEKMKRLNNILGLVGALLMLIGSVLKLRHMPGAGITLVLGGGIAGLAYFPTMIVMAMRTPMGMLGRARQIIGPVAASVLVIGILFKLQHWPYANILMTSGMIGIALGFIPLFLLTLRKEKTLQVTPLSVGILMILFSCMGFSLVNLGPSRAYTEMVAQLPNELADDLAAQRAVNKQALTSATASPQLSALTDAAKAVYDQAETLKRAMVNQLHPGTNVQLPHISGQLAMTIKPQVTNTILLRSESGPTNAQELKQQISAFLDAYAVTTGQRVSNLESILKLEDRGEQSWEMYYFHNQPVFTLFTNLSRLEQAVAKLEWQAIVAAKQA